MTGQRILVVDDDLHIRRLLHSALSRTAYDVIEAKTGAEALRVAEAPDAGRIDAVLLDLGLPDRDGLELVPVLLARLKAPLIVVSARESTDDKVAALDLGAVDYVTKPFDSEELLARLRAALRQRVSLAGAAPVLRAGDLVIDIPNRLVTKNGVEVHLTRKEYDVLATLAMSPGRVVTHSRLLETVWPQDDDRNVQYLRTVVRNLRVKVEADPAQPLVIRNETGIGYRLIAEH